jgi:hypothetical protein
MRATAGLIACSALVVSVFCAGAGMVGSSDDNPEARSQSSELGPRTGTSATSTKTPAFRSVSTPATAGDVDGDGKLDQLALELRDGRPFLIASLTRLGKQDVPVAGLDAALFEDKPQGPRVLGVVDIDRDGFGEVFAEIDHGASTSFFTLFKLIDGRLVQMTLDGKPVRLPLGGSVAHFDAIGCGTGKLVVAGWGRRESCPNAQTGCQGGDRRTYVLDGPRLHLVSKTTHEFGECLDPLHEGCPPRSELEAAGYAISCDPVPFN